MVKKDDFGVKTTGNFRELFSIFQSNNNPPIIWNKRGDNPRVLFVYHNDIEDGFIHPALAILGGQMEQHGIEHRLFDTSFMRDVKAPFKESVRELRERIGEEAPSGYRPERKYVDLRQEFWREVEEFRPDLIALSSTSYDFKPATEFMLPAKRAFGIPVIVGGPHAMVAPDRAIKNPAIDFVCVGEGEMPLLYLVQAINSGKDASSIRSLWFKDPVTGNVLRNPKAPGIESLDDLPMPDWDMFDERHILRPWMGTLRRQGYVEISRGCPFKCSYCIQPNLHDIPNEGGKTDSKNYKYHSSSERLVERIKKLRDRYGFDHMQLIDENLPTMPLKDLQDILMFWNKALNPKRDLTFFTMSRPEYLIRKWPDGNWLKNGKALSSGKAEVLREMGCVTVAMGAESGNEFLRSEILNRPMQPGILEAASKVLTDNGIQVSLYNIIGFPFETREMLFDTIEQMWRIKPDRYSVRHLTPYPGTPIRNLAVNMGFVHPEYEDADGGAKSFLHEPVLNLPEEFDMQSINLSEISQHEKPHQEGESNGNGCYSESSNGMAYHPSGRYVRHPSKEELMGLRKLFGIYAFSPTKAMWRVIELAEDRGLAKGHSELQRTVYEAFSRARTNRSEDDDSYRPEIVVGQIIPGDISWADCNNAHLYIGRPRALLPIVEMAEGKGYAEKVPEIATYVREAFAQDIEERRQLGINDLLEKRRSTLENERAEKQVKVGMMVSGL